MVFTVLLSFYLSVLHQSQLKHLSVQVDINGWVLLGLITPNNTHFRINRIKRLCTDPGSSWPRGWWRHSILPNIWYHIPRIYTDLQSSAIKRGNIGNRNWKTTICNRSLVTRGLGHHMGLGHQMGLGQQQVKTADKWGSWSDQLKITTSINHVISRIPLHY